MTLEKLENLLAMAAPRIMRTSLGREANRPREKLCFTLHYLVSGDSRVMIAARYRISPVTINSNFNKTCLEIRNSLLQKSYVAPPEAPDNWKKPTDDSFWICSFPDCTGCCDGKHIVIQVSLRYYSYT